MLSQENPAPPVTITLWERLGLILPLLKNLLQPSSIIKHNCNNHYHSQRGPIIFLLLAPLPSLLQPHWPSCYSFLPQGLCTCSFCCLGHCLLVLIIADSFLSFRSQFKYHLQEASLMSPTKATPFKHITPLLYFHTTDWNSFVCLPDSGYLLLCNVILQNLAFTVLGVPGLRWMYPWSWFSCGCSQAGMGAIHGFPV